VDASAWFAAVVLLLWDATNIQPVLEDSPEQLPIVFRAIIA
jgi:hypothetical protein